MKMIHLCHVAENGIVKYEGKLTATDVHSFFG